MWKYIRLIYGLLSLRCWSLANLLHVILNIEPRTINTKIWSSKAAPTLDIRRLKSSIISRRHLQKSALWRYLLHEGSLRQASLPPHASNRVNLSLDLDKFHSLSTLSACTAHSRPQLATIIPCLNRATKVCVPEHLQHGTTAPSFRLRAIQIASADPPIARWVQFECRAIAPVYNCENTFSGSSRSYIARTMRWDTEKIQGDLPRRIVSSPSNR